MKELGPQKNFILYNDQNGEVKLKVFLSEENLWLTQKGMAALFGVEENTITYHIKEVFKDGELDIGATARKFRVVQNEGSRQVNRELDFYNLDMIISVGYRVNSKQATQFRIWATKTLKEFMVKGFVMDDERLKQGEVFFKKDYFRELLERVRSIRTSERRIWLQITDIFSECSIDYDKNSDLTKDFFATIQNKFHFAISGQTAAEIIYQKVDSKKPYMGLTTWKNSPNGRILKTDVIIAKNYLQEKEIKRLERTVSSFFDYIENQIESQNTFTMLEFVKAVNKFLEFNNFKVLQGKGKISKEKADRKAEKEYSVYNKVQKIESDFEKFTKSIKSAGL